MPQDKELRKRMGLPIEDESANGGTGEGNDGNTGGEGGSGDGSGEGGGSGGGNGSGGNSQQPPVPVELSDEELLAQIRKRNPNINSLDDISKPPTQDDPETAKKKKKTAALQHALQSQFITQEEYEGSIRDSARDTRSIVYEEFVNTKKAAGWDQTKIDKAFAKKYAEDIDMTDADADDIVAEANTSMENEKERILRRRYPKIGKIEAHYDSHLDQVSKEDKYTKELTVRHKSYITDVDRFLTDYSKFPKTIGDRQTGSTVDVEFTVSPEVIDQVKKEFLTKEAMAAFIANDYDADKVQNAIRVRLLDLTHDAQINHYAQSYHSNKMTNEKFGRKNLNADEAPHGSEVPEVDMEARSRVGL